MRAPTLLLATALLTCFLPGAARAEGEDTPVRDKRHIMVGLELGWNTLSGLGVNGSYHFFSRLSLDAGVGLSLEGIKTGLRARVNLLTSEWTPFAAAGILYGFGGGSREVNVPAQNFSFKIGPSPYAQFVAGVDYTGESGFTFLATAGYALLLRNNVTVTSGPLSPTSQAALNLVTGSGIEVGFALGYSF